MEEPRDAAPGPEDPESPSRPEAKAPITRLEKKPKKPQARKAQTKKAPRSPWWIRGGGWSNLPQWGRVLIIVGIVGVGLAIGFAVRSHLPAPSVVTFQLKVSASPVGTGQVEISPVYQSYREASQVNLTAVAAPGYEFSGWSGDASGTEPEISLTMDSDKEIVAGFRSASYSLTTQVSPAGAGSVTPSGGDYDKGSPVAIAAVPAPGYEFSGWSGDASGTEPTISVTMDSDKLVTASFQPRRYSLSVIATPVEGGSVSPASGLYENGTSVTLTAVPEVGYEFSAWSGAVFSSSPTVTITMDSDKEVVAAFVATFQHIDTVMPKGISGSITVLTNRLQSGDMITGFIELTGEFASQDRSFDWSAEIIAPGGTTIDIFRGHWIKEYHYDMNVRAPYDGEYRIRIRHNSLSDKTLTVRIQPEGWEETP